MTQSHLKDGRPLRNACPATLLFFLLNHEMVFVTYGLEKWYIGSQTSAEHNASHGEEAPLQQSFDVMQNTSESLAQHIPARLAKDSVAQSRRLANIIVEQDWIFPTGTKLQFRSYITDSTFGSGAPSAVDITLMAGYKYRAVDIFAPQGTEFAAVDHNGATIKLVDSDATRDQCTLAFFHVPMSRSQLGISGPQASVFGPSPFAMGSIEELLVATNHMYKELVSPFIMFMSAGQYQFCYTPDGTFSGDEWKNALVPVLINVAGVSSGCGTDDCLSLEKWECWFTYRAEAQGPCDFDLRRSAGRLGWSLTTGGVSRMSWTTAWATEFVNNGVFYPADPQRCSDVATGDFIDPETLRFDPADMPSSKSTTVDTVIIGTLPKLRQEYPPVTDSFTLTVCYCPNYNGPHDASEDACIHRSEFIQSFGRVYYWMIRLCSTENYAGCGVTENPAARVVPQQPFVLRLQCPSGGRCAGATENRIRFIARPSDPTEDDRPFWDPLARCRYEDVPEYTAGYMWLPQTDALSGLPLHGGTRRDYKIWQQRHLQFMVSFGQALDVCYCDTDCSALSNFFQVGRIQSGELGVARWSKDINLYVPGSAEFAPIHAVQYVGKPGAITLYGGVITPSNEGPNPYDTVLLGKKALLKIISYDREDLYTLQNGLPVYSPDLPDSQRKTLEKALQLDKLIGPSAQAGLDAACAGTPYRQSLVTGVTSVGTAKDFIAPIPENSLAQYMAFTGIENDQTIIARSSGTLSICYCAMIDAAEQCMADNYWLHAAKVLARGPRGSQTILLPTQTHVGFQLEGWGFQSSDTLRFVDVTQSCAENGFNPPGKRFFRMGCPGVNGDGCRLPAILENVRTFVDSGDSTGVYISEVSFGEYNTSLTFTGDISGEKLDQLKEADGITIDPSTVQLNGRNFSNLTAHERHMVGRLTGMFDYADDNQAMRMLLRRVSYQHRYADGKNQIDSTKVSLNIGFSEAETPDITFIGNGGNWLRRNILRTHNEFLAFEPVTAKICHAVTDEGTQKYYAAAGEIQFINPKRMDFVGLHFTSQVQGSKAPAVVSFVPQRGNPAYLDLTIPLILRILFIDVGTMLEPLVSGDLNVHDLEPLNPNISVAMENASQVLCGKMFNEMWTNDVQGFPLPRGCYYGLQYQSAPVEGNFIPSPKYREYFIVFEPQKGMKSTCIDYRTDIRGACLYMLVFNARVGAVTPTNTEAVAAYVNCAPQPGGVTPCGPEFFPLEYGPAQVNLYTYAPDNETAQLAHAEVGEQGHIRGNSLEDLYLEGREFQGLKIWGLEVRVWPKDLAIGVAKGSLLRLFFFPLTIWEIGRDLCDAECIPPPNSSYTCSDGRAGTVAACKKGSAMFTRFDTVVNMPRNLLELEYPKEMDEIEANSTYWNMTNVSGNLTPVAYRRVVPVADASAWNITDQQLLLVKGGVRLPERGFFPTRFLVQLSDANDEKPSIAYTTTTFAMLAPRGATSGSLLITGQTGSGEKPFVQDRGNDMILYFTLGVTLRNNETNLLAHLRPKFEIELPDGFRCSILGDGIVRTSDLFTTDRDEDGYSDYVNQSLNVGSWSSNERKCMYTLDDYGAIFAGQRFFLAITVDNPTFSIPRNDPSNVWTMSVISVGGVLHGNVIPFITLEEEKLLQYRGWQGNLAVIEPLAEENIQPTNFTPKALQTLHVFFKAVHSMPPLSFIMLDAPDYFDFGSECTLEDLPAEYYADWYALPWGEELLGPRSRARRLGRVASCIGDVWGWDAFKEPPTENFTRAQIRLSDALVSDADYAFGIHIRNAYNFSAAQFDNWKMWIKDPEGYVVDGSRYTIQFSPARIDSVPDNAYDRSWAIYMSGLKLPVEFDFGSPAILPTIETGMSAYLRIYPLEIDVSGLRFVAIRIIAPVGYLWDVFTTQGFLGYIPGITCADCRVTVNPQVLFKNELILPDAPMRGGLQYGFQVRMKIPRRPPTRSSNMFSIEIAFDSLVAAQRMQASLVEPPPLRVIYDASIFSLCNVDFYDTNVFGFHFNTVTELRPQDGFIFRGNEGTRDTIFRCPPVAAIGTQPLPEDLECSYFRHPNTDLPIIILHALYSTFPAGKYGITFERTRNPNDPGSLSSSMGGSWIVGTYRNVNLYPQLEVADLPSLVPAPRVRSKMNSSAILHPPEWEKMFTGRDDRPAHRNRLIFYFQLSEPARLVPGTPLTIALRAPFGFTFDLDCLHVLHTLNVSDPRKPTTTTTTETFYFTTTTSRRTTTTSTTLHPNCTNETMFGDENDTNFTYICKEYLGSTTTTSVTTTTSTTSTTTTSTTSTSTTNVTTTTTTSTLPNSTWPCMATNFTSKSWCDVVIQDWPDELRPLSCAGIGNTAKITLPNPPGVSLMNDTLYGFQIGMLNPDSASIGTGIGYWAMDIGTEASFPMDSFIVRTFAPATTSMRESSSAVTYATPAIYNSGNVIAITFTPSLFVPSKLYGLEGGGRRLQNYLPDAEEGFLILIAPHGFSFSISDRQSTTEHPICSRSILEVNGRQPDDIESLFSEGTDIICRVEENNRTKIRFLGTKPLEAGQTYRYVFYVNNPFTPEPAEPWFLYSFKTKIDESVKEYGRTMPLDMFRFPGYRVAPAVARFEFENLSGEYNGDFDVRRIRFTFEFNDNLLNGDQIILTAPVGFSLLPSGTTGSSQCINFNYPDTLLPLLDSPYPVCSCDSERCRLVLSINEISSTDGVAFLRNTPLRFDIGGINPPRTPDVTGNYWKVSHNRDDLAVASRIREGWVIYAVPQDLSVSITGINFRAGAFTELTLRFVPTVFALAMTMEIYEPTGFNFELAVPGSPWLRDDRTFQSKFVTSGGKIVKGEVMTIVIKDVRLGNIGGETMMNFGFYSDVFLQQPAGRRNNFTKGFRLPGALAVQSQYLYSLPVIAHYEQNQTDAVLPLLPVLTGTTTRLELTFSVTMPVFVGNHLYIRSEVDGDFETYPLLLNHPDYYPTLTRCSNTPSTFSVHTQCQVVGSAVNITHISTETRGAGLQALIVELRMTLEHSAVPTPGGWVLPPSSEPVLQPGAIYRIRIFCRPTGVSIKWHLQTLDGGDLPTNTNDGITDGITSVAPISMDVTAIRTPPSSVVSANVVVQPGAFGSTVQEVHLILPVNYSMFRGSASPAIFEDTGRIVTKMDMLPSVLMALGSAGVTLNPRVVTPAAMVLDSRWFMIMYTWPADLIEARTMENAQMVSWGNFSGWMLSALNVTLTYANIEAFTGHVAMFFTVPLLATGVFTNVTAPAGFILGCPGEQAGRPPPKCSANARDANISLVGQGKIEGTSRAYSFTIPMTTPLFPPEVNDWDLRIYDRDGIVVDGVIGIQKDTYVPAIYVRNPFITWGNPPQRGETSTLKITFPVDRRIWRLRAILITLPEGYRHDIQHPNQFKSKTKTFPIAIDIPWRNYENYRWVRVLVAMAASSVDFVPSGTYEFELPVMVPLFQPLATEFYFSLCKSYECERAVPPDEHVLVSFPMINPNAILAPKSFTKPITSSSLSSRRLYGFVFLGLLLILSCMT